jgi:hypothetical protein
VDERRVEWWEWREGDYASLPMENGLIKSCVFPGLWLDVTALIQGQAAQALKQLERGLATAEHHAFAAELRSRLSNR